ncbi:MAG: hypothetical protein AMXMBFR59_06790 [Rhodanobacteraceae bacterium]
MRSMVMLALLAVSGTAFSGEMTVRKDGVGCRSQDDYSTLVKLAASGDEQAFGQAYTAGILAGLCVKFTPGETVYLEDTAIFSGQIKVRKKGEVAGYWTAIETAK